MAEPTDKDRRIIIPMPQTLVDDIDDYRFEMRFPSRAEAVRSLLEFALQTLWQDKHQKEKA